MAAFHHDSPLNPDPNSLLEPRHCQEWDKSGVDPAIRELNVKSLSGNSGYEFLLWALPRTARRNDGRLRDNILKQYGHTEQGGWWISGLDPLNNWEEMEWGRFKPDNPRLEWNRETNTYGDKSVKYESPPNTPNRVTYFRVPLHVWKKVAERYGVDMPEDIEGTPEGEARGFWAWVQKNPTIPIILTEGEKKAACLLSFGFVAIALPGIWNGRVGKDESEQLHPDLIPMTQPERTFVILFDYETKPQTKDNISHAIRRTGAAIQQQIGCKCEVALLPGPEKGVDDWVMALGNDAQETLTALMSSTLTLDEYQTTFHFHRRRGLGKYKPDMQMNTRYLSDEVQLPESGLVCIKSDMGTGKTELLARRRIERPNEPFLNIGHRVNLLKNLAERLKTEMYSSLGSRKLSEVTALSITIDSLYKLEETVQTYGCLLIDEASQFVNHLLTSSTCQKHRLEIFAVLKYLVYATKLVVLADAHLDDVTIRFFYEMRPELGQPYIIENLYRSGGRQVYWYEGNNNSAIVARIHTEIMLGRKVMVVSSTRKFTKTLERALLNHNPAKSETELNATTQPLLKIWTIHGENSGSEENVEFIRDINNAVKTVDVLNVSPSLGTGVDISEYHFDVIFGVFDGDALSATDAAQQLWRYRPDVPMHVWVRPRPSFGYNEISMRRIKENMIKKNEMTTFLIRMDRLLGRRGAEDEWIFDTYCHFQARHNWSVNNLRTDLLLLLEEMGNTIILVGDENDAVAKCWMKEAKHSINQEHFLNVANAKDIDHNTWEWRQHLDYLKPEEIWECLKYQIQEAYGMPVTPELVEKHDDGRLLKRLIALEALIEKPEEGSLYDEAGREFPLPPAIVSDYDRNNRERHKISMDWSHRSTEWLMRHRLGVDELVRGLMEGQSISADDPRLEELAQKAIFAAPHIKSVLGITIAINKSPMWIFSQFLAQLGLSTVSRRLGSRDHRVRVYSLNPDDVTFAKHVLSWRQQRREERERQRLLDQEATQEQTTALSTQEVSTTCPDSTTYINTIIETKDTTPEEFAQKEEKFWGKVRGIAHQVLPLLDAGIEEFKQIFASLTIEERWAVLLSVKKIDQAAFARFSALYPEWQNWCRA